MPEYDVYVCYREPAGSDLARRVSADLGRRGFRVFTGDPSSTPTGRALEIIEATPDFVLILTPGALEPCTGKGDRVCLEVAHALKTERRMVPVPVSGFVWPAAGSLPRELSLLDARQRVPYSAENPRESLALIAHRLSSEASVDERRLMRQAKWVGGVLAVILLAIVSVPMARGIQRFLTASPPPEPLPPFALYWTSFGQRLDKGRPARFAVEDGATVLPGDEVRLAFSPSADGFAYVVSRDLSGRITVLFPPRTIPVDAHVREGLLYTAPADEGWLRIDEPSGVQALYIFASYDPIENLEALVEERFEEATLEARLGLLQTVLAGLLDGTHATIRKGLRNRNGRPIVQDLEVPLRHLSASATLAGGEVVTRELQRQPGVLSALAEIRLLYLRSR